MVDSRSGATLAGVVTREDRYEGPPAAIVTVYSGWAIDEILEDFEATGTVIRARGAEAQLLALGELLAAEWTFDDAGPGCEEYGVLANGLDDRELQAVLDTAEYQ
jgi:hypothetical protein